MLFALKDEQGNVLALSDRQVADQWSSIDMEDQSLLAFLQKNPAIGGKVMQAADADFIRVLEDVIDLLIDKQIIQYTELPEAVQTKLLNRRRYREELRRDDTTELLDSDDSIF